MCRSCSEVKSSLKPSEAAFDRTQLSAACMDSRITSPSCPVIVKPPLPFMRFASMNSTSPPAGVHARPTETPERFVRSARVVPHDVAHALFRKFDQRAAVITGLNPVLLDLPRNQVAERDVHLLL